VGNEFKDNLQLAASFKRVYLNLDALTTNDTVLYIHIDLPLQVNLLHNTFCEADSTIIYINCNEHRVTALQKWKLPNRTIGFKNSNDKIKLHMYSL